MVFWEFNLQVFSPEKLQFCRMQRCAEVVKQKLFQFTRFFVNFITSLHFAGKVVTFYCTMKCFRCSWLFSAENVFWGQSVVPVYNMSPEVNRQRFCVIRNKEWRCFYDFITSKVLLLLRTWKMAQHERSRRHFMKIHKVSSFLFDESRNFD